MGYQLLGAIAVEPALRKLVGTAEDACIVPLDPDADAGDLAYPLLTVIRGTDVVGAYGHSPARLTSMAESAFALLPRPRHR
ncbi:hypothetical protein ACWED2_09545 [Amycolatopsis sp. NPDC005003]